MHALNPLRTLETPENDIHLRDLLPSGARDAFGAVTSGELSWRLVETTSDIRQPVTVWTNNISFYPPRALLEDMEGWNIYVWMVVADIADSAGRLALVSIAGMLAALESELVARRLVPAAVLARALLEHAVVLDHLTTTFVEQGVEDWLKDDGRRIRAYDELPVDIILPLFRTINGGKINWDFWGSKLGNKKIEETKKGLKQGQTAINVLSLIDRREKGLGREGLRWTYERLCEIAHPSRGSRELMRSGRLEVEGEEVGRHYAVTPPSDVAYLHRVQDTVVPVIHETALIVFRYSETFMPLLDDLGNWTRDALTRRGHDVGELLAERKPSPDVDSVPGGCEN